MIVVLIPQYGNCYMFNTAWNPKDPSGGKRVSSKTGDETGLSLELFVDQTDYIKSSVASSVGAIVTIHSPNEWPNPIEQGYIVQPNTRNVFALQAQCERLRTAAEIAKTCKCLDPGIQDNFLHDGVSYLRYHKCNISIGRIRSRNAENGYYWSHQSNLVALAVVKQGLDGALSSLRGTEEFNKVTEQFRKEVLKVEVFFRSLNIQVIQEQPKYDYHVPGFLGVPIPIYREVECNQNANDNITW
ncbi:unnamed protein product [Darwinula stevensoni]|uniref:Uncharacterized protein n=1 Tax=Darwinula stevensoni TaxID=69355 RepID=A0A7R9A7K9_9CRUS|nr:unnamed protein product [Darwinula stevensoni]CAG0893870.1 unnamed protein product [Darwinula stevensoni]